MAHGTKAKSALALLGGEKAVKSDSGDIFAWPIVTKEHEDAVLDVLRRGAMSNTDVTQQLEREYAQALGMTYALGCNNGTSAIHCALYGLGVGVGDEVIAPSITFWATVTQVYSLGATPVFANVDPETLCIDPKDIESCITERTKAIIPVHYSGMPADMDAILALARKHNVKLLEDCSHAHGALYKGQEVGTFGDASAFSLMSGKSLAIGEAGIMFTNDQRVYERALLLGHYERHESIKLDDLRRFAQLPCGGYKYRMHQASSAFGRVQLRKYPTQMAEIDQAMNFFCDLLEGVPGIRPIRPAKGSNTTKGGWYFPLAHYAPEELGGLSIQRFADAVRAEGSACHPGCNKPLHVHPLFTEMDVYGHGKPTRFANLPAGAETAHLTRRLPVAEGILPRVCSVPWFKRYRPAIIEEHAAAYRKVAENARDLLPGDEQKDTQAGGYSSFWRGT